MHVRSVTSSANEARAATEFDWFRHWYPVHTIDAMDPDAEYKVRLLGLELLIRHRADAEPSASWEVFEPAGLDAYPTKIVYDLLFVFPQLGPNAHEEAALVRLPITEELRNPSQRSVWKTASQVRDFVCGWDAACENLMDPAHFCSAHHNTLGDRYRDPIPFEFDRRRNFDGCGGFAFDGDAGTIEFYPPCLVNYYPKTAGMPLNGKAFLSTYAVPTAPGRVRFIATVLRDEAPIDQTLATTVLAIFNRAPTWFQHVMSPIVLHQDSGLLYYQYRNLREKGYRPQQHGSTDIRQHYYCPSPVDKGIMLFHRWLRGTGGGGPPWACADDLPPRGTEDIFDIWGAHTTNCRHCTDAYTGLEAARIFCAVAFCAAIVLLPVGSQRTAVAVAFAAITAALTAFSSLFRRYECSHSGQSLFNPLGLEVFF